MILVKCQRSFKISFFDPNYAFPWPQAPTPPYNAHAHRQDLFLYPILRSIDFRRTWCFDNLDISNWKYTKKLQNHKGEAFTNKSRCVTTKNCHCLKMEHDFVIRHLLVLNLSVQGVPKKKHFQNAAGATVHWLNHHLPAPLVSRDCLFGRFFLRLSRIKPCQW